MKWVHIGIVQAIGFVLVAAYLDKKHRMEILAGGGFAATAMYGQYVHARSAGLASNEPGTESY